VHKHSGQLCVAKWSHHPTTLPPSATSSTIVPVARWREHHHFLADLTSPCPGLTFRIRRSTAPTSKHQQA